MMRLAAFMVALALPALAQEQASTGSGAILRALDKVNGQTTDLEMPAGTTTIYGRLQVTMNECRYPAGNPAGDAFAHVSVTERATDTSVFDGWMVASSPALNPMDHARYDVWVIRCSTS